MYITIHSCPAKKTRRACSDPSASLWLKELQWNCVTRPPYTALTEVINTEAQSRWGKKGKGSSQELPFLPFAPWLLYDPRHGNLENPGFFKHQEWEERSRRFPTGGFIRFFLRNWPSKNSNKKKGACNIRHAKTREKLFSKEHIQNQEVLNTHKTWHLQFLQANAFISTCLGNTPWHLKHRIQRKKDEKVHPAASASKILKSFPYISSFTNPIWKKVKCSQLPWIIFSSLAATPPLNDSPQQSDHALAASAAPIDFAHASPSTPSTFHGHHARV